jgi:hypothetical protein
MGKIRGRDKGKKSQTLALLALKSPSAQSTPLNGVASSGKITKNKSILGKKSSVSCRSDLTDVLAVQQVLQTADRIQTKLPKKLIPKGLDLLPDSSETSFRRAVKAQVREKKARHQIKRDSFRKSKDLYEYM